MLCNRGRPIFFFPQRSLPIFSQAFVPKTNQNIATCPGCQAMDLRRRHRTFWEKAIYRRIYRCTCCGRSRRVVRLIEPAAWMESKLRYIYDGCLRHARLWRSSPPDRNAQPISRSSRCVDLVRDVILDLETQLTRLRAKAQKGVHSGERR